MLVVFGDVSWIASDCFGGLLMLTEGLLEWEGISRLCIVRKRRLPVSR